MLFFREISLRLIFMLFFWAIPKIW